MNDRVVATALAALVLFARAPFAAGLLWAWDSVLYAHALEQGFHVDADLIGQRPHPPGYVFYVATAALLRLLVRDSNTALVLVSVIASALSAAVVYLLSRRFAERPAALVASLAFAAAPLAWTYGEVAMPYALLGLLSVALAALFLRARARVRATAMASLAFGLAAGFRQDLLLIAGPLWLWMLWPVTWRTRALALAAVTLGCVAWAVPTVVLSGGLATYVTSVTGQTGRVGELSPASGDVSALARNLLLIAYGLWWGLLGFAALFIAVIAAALRMCRPSGTSVFFMLWVVPAALVYVFVHIGDPGYLLSILPAFYVAFAALVRTVPPARAMVLGLATVLAVVNAAIFLVVDVPYSWNAIARHDGSLIQRTAYARRTFSPADTVIVAQVDYLLAKYYLPEFHVLFYGSEPQALSRSARPVSITAPAEIVVFGALIDPLPASLAARSDGPLTTVKLGAGSAIIAYDIGPR